MPQKNQVGAIHHAHHTTRPLGVRGVAGGPRAPARRRPVGRPNGCETGKLTAARGRIILSDVGRKVLSGQQTATVAYDCMDSGKPSGVMDSVTASLTEVKP